MKRYAIILLIALVSLVGALSAAPSPPVAKAQVASVQVGDGSMCNADHNLWTMVAYIPGHIPHYAHYVCTIGTGGYWTWVFQYWSDH